MIRPAAALAVLALAACGRSSQGDDPGDVYVPAPFDGGADATTGGDGGYLGQVDRAAHPLVTVLLVPTVLQDGYNAQATFGSTPTKTTADALGARLGQLDALVLDGGPDPVDWPVPDGGVHPLEPLFAQDVLLVDTARACAAPDGGFVRSYLELDREVFLSGPPHVTCGGRTPAEGVVDETLQLVVTGDRDGGPRVSQGVAGPTRAPTTSFPYLAPPG